MLGYKLYWVCVRVCIFTPHTQLNNRARLSRTIKGPSTLIRKQGKLIISNG